MSTSCLALPGQDGWGICGVGLIDSPGERAKAKGMTAQDGLYTLSLFPPKGEPSSSVVGAIVDYLFAPGDPGAVLARLRDPAIKIVSLTVTEGGYNLDEASGQFRLDAPDIVHDLAHPEAPRTVFGFIVTALARATGRRLAAVHRAVVRQSPPQWRHRPPGRAGLRRRPRACARGVDRRQRHLPQLHGRPHHAGGRPADVARLNERTGIDDQVPIFAESFIQWVVEDRFCAGRPALEQVGVQFTGDVAAYEQIKLRMLNATHTMLSYPGLLAGYRLVHEAMADPQILGYLRRFLDRDVIPLLEAPPGMALRGLSRRGAGAVRQSRRRATSCCASPRTAPRRSRSFSATRCARLWPAAPITGASPSCSRPSPATSAASTTGAPLTSRPSRI